MYDILRSLSLPQSLLKGRHAPFCAAGTEGLTEKKDVPSRDLKKKVSFDIGLKIRKL